MSLLQTLVTYAPYSAATLAFIMTVRSFADQYEDEQEQKRQAHEAELDRIERAINNINRG